MSESLLLEQLVEERENVIFVRPHAQFPRLAGGEPGGWDWSLNAGADSFLPEMSRFIELVGRVCYKSEDRITGESASRFLKMIVSSGHHSVIEHVSLTVKFVGSRAMSHQLVRHRLASFSQESQRYCNYGKRAKLYAVMPPSVFNAAAAMKEEFVRSVDDAYRRYLSLLQQGIRAEDARNLLPNATKTEVVTTLNLRQWRHVFEERGLNTAAQWEIRRITLDVLEAFNNLTPEIFSDLWKKRNEARETIEKDIRYSDEPDFIQ